MKKIIFIFAALLLHGSVFAAAIVSIGGSAAPCPTASTTYTATYAFVQNPPYYNEVVTSVIWEFIQNGKVIYKKVTGGASGFGTGISQVVLSPTSVGGEIMALPTGETEIKVTMFYIAIFPSGPPLQLVAIKKRDIFIGVPAAESISGNNICPNTSGIFTIPSLANSTSYTWEVPVGWKVNGVTGPVVTGQGTTVSITPCPFTNGSPQSCETILYKKYTLKVKGVSTACGVSNYTTKTITIDYPVDIIETNLSNNTVRLNATPDNLPSYQWTLDPVWTFPATGNKNLPEITFNSKGLTGLAKLTYKTSCQNTYTRNWWWVKPAQPGDPGWPGEPENPGPGDCEPEIPMMPNSSAKSGHVIYLKDPCNDVPPIASIFANGEMKRVTLTKSFDGYEYDMSELKAGSYILRVKSASGKYKTVKFIKLD